MRKQCVILVTALLAVLTNAPPAGAQTSGYSQFFAYAQTYPSGTDTYLTYLATGSPNSGVMRGSPTGITDFYYGHFYEAGQSLDCRVGHDCLTHPYSSFGDGAGSSQYTDFAWYFPNTGPYRFRTQANGYTHTADWLNGSTWQQIGSSVTTSFINLPFVFMGYESPSNARLDRSMFFNGAKYFALGAWYNFCPTTFLDAGDNGAILYPCRPDFAGSFSVLPGMRVFLPLQRRP